MPTRPRSALSEAVVAVLRDLEADGWAALHDLRGQGAPWTALDHVAVGPGGVVVVGDAAGDPAEGAATVTALLAPRHRSAVHAVRVSETVPADAAAVPVVVPHEGLAAHLRALPVRLPAADVSGLVQHLGLHLEGPQGPDVASAVAMATGGAGRRRAVRPLTDDTPPQAYAPAPVLPRVARAWDVAPERLGPMGLVLRGAVVVSAAWVSWVFTTVAFGLG